MRQGLIVYVFSILVWTNHLQAQWPQWRGPMRNGVSTETHLLKSWPAEGPQLVWSCDAIGDGYSSAIIQDKIIYVSGMKDSAVLITALDLKGTFIWQKEIGENIGHYDWGESSTPTLYQGKLYTLTIPGELCCVDAKTGDLDWEINIPDKFGGVSNSYYVNKNFCESPLVEDDQVIVTPGGLNTTMVALNRVTGETIWTSECIGDETSYVSPVLVQGKDKKFIATMTKDHLLVADFNSGAIVWKARKSPESFVPLPLHNQIYFPSCMMLNISDDLKDFKSLWSDTSQIKNWGGAVNIGNRIFGTYEQSSGIFCLDWDTGKQLALNKGIRGANLLAADGMIYSYEEKGGRVSLLKPTDNNIEIISSFKVKLGKGIHLAHMSIGNGILFVRHGDILMAYDIKQT